MSDARGTNDRSGRLVWNDLWGEFSAQSPARMSRDKGAIGCPFCADIVDGAAPEGARAWIRPNDYPALTPPDGECLILIYSRDHNRRFSDLAPDEA